ncbi:unnamed protein product, partial [Prorocentrum cordatum]
MAARTLDICRAQVLVRYPDEDLEWHRLVLLHTVEGTLGLGLTPDHEIVRVDLGVMRHHAQDQSSAFPTQFAPLVYSFDPADGQTLRDGKRRAQRRAALLGGGEVEDAEVCGRLLVSVADARFSEAVPADVVEDGGRCVSFDDREVCMIDGGPRFVERVPRGEWSSGAQSCREDVEDIRVLGGYRSRVGRRDLDFRDSVESMRETTVADWPDRGPRACSEYSKSSALGAGNPLTYQAEWQRLSGVADGGVQGHGHRSHLGTLLWAICLDQPNEVNLACFERAARRPIQVEMAVEKNPRRPVFSGLEDVLAGPRSVSDSARAPRYLARATNRQKDRARILMQLGLYQEEASRRQSVKGGGKGETGDGLRAKQKAKLEPRHLASYDTDKLHVASGALRPVPASDLPPVAAAGYLRHFESQVELTAPELEAGLQTAGGLSTPYWDPALRGDRSARCDFFCRLAAAGVVGFRRAIKSRCGDFFVHKNDGRIRFFCDARRANLCHRRPPRTVLGGPASLSELDLSPLAEALGGYGGALELPLDLHASSADVKDCFYQLVVESIASWFGLDCPLTVEEWGLEISHVYDDDLKGPTPVEAGELLYPVMRGLPMGAVYVDNFTGLGGCQEDAAFGVRGFERAAAGAGLKLHVPEVAVAELESLGLVIHGSDKTLRHTPHRVWRFHFGTKELLRRGRCAPAELRAWAGHAVHLFSLQPLLLSILQDAYTFIGNGIGPRRPLPRGVRLELRLAAALVFLGGVNLAAPYDDEVRVSDSSTGGYCLMYGRKPARAVRGAWRWRERWRFVEVEAECDGAHYTGAYLAQLRGLPADDGLEVELLSVAPKLLVALTRDEGWRRAVAGRRRHPEEHVNIEEARACVMGLRRSCRGPRHHGHRVLSLRDNMVTCCCLDKGRSTSRALNTQCRQAAGYALGCGIRRRVRHVPTDLCVADYGSRLHEPPEPQWLCAAKAGHARELESAKVFLELFSGTGGLSQALVSAGLRVGFSFDIRKGAQKGVKDLKRARATERLGVEFALFTSEVVRTCQRCNVLWSTENPASSGLWSFPPVGGLAGLAGARWVKFPMCAYGVPHQKWTALLINSPTLASLAAEHGPDVVAAPLRAMLGRLTQQRAATRAVPEPTATSRSTVSSSGTPARSSGRRSELAETLSTRQAGSSRALAPRRRRAPVAEVAARARHATAAGRSRTDYIELESVSEVALTLYRVGVDELGTWNRLNGRQNNVLVNVDATLVSWMTDCYLRLPEALAFGPKGALAGCADAGAKYVVKVMLRQAPGDRGQPTNAGIFDDVVEVSVADRDGT